MDYDHIRKRQPITEALKNGLRSLEATGNTNMPVDVMLTRKLNYLANFLQAEKLSHGRFHDHGCYAVLFEMASGEMLRISPSGDAYKPEPARAEVPSVLQPFKTLSHDDLNIELLPKVRCFSWEDLDDPEKRPMVGTHLASLLRATADTGHLFWDVRPSNFGLLCDGTPVIVDGGAVLLPSKNPYTAQCEKLSDLLVDYTDLHDRIFGDMPAISSPEKIIERLRQTLPEVDVDFASSQREHSRQSGISAGVLNIVPHLERSGCVGEFLTMASRGMYESEIKHKVAEAIWAAGEKDYLRNETAPLCLRAELALHAEEDSPPQSHAGKISKRLESFLEQRTEEKKSADIGRDKSPLL